MAGATAFSDRDRRRRGARAANPAALGCLQALLAGVLGSVLGAVGAQAQEGSLEYPIKATFLARFGSYVSWPANAFAAPRSPIRLCVVGTDPFGTLLDELVRGERIGERGLAVQRLSSLESGSGCHIVYVGETTAQTLGDIVEATSGEPALIVTDSAHSVERGAIHFTVAGDRVRFHVDERVAAQNGLALSARLLDVALSVQRRNPS